MRFRHIVVAAASVFGLACGSILTEKSDPARDPAHPDAEGAPIVRASDLSRTEEVIVLGPLEGTSPPSGEHEHHPTKGAGLFVCPMHPEVMSARPGTCPKCGMKLKPKATEE